MNTVSVTATYTDNLLHLAIVRFCTALNYEKHLQMAQTENTWLAYGAREIRALEDGMNAEIREMSAMAQAWAAEQGRAQ